MSEETLDSLLDDSVETSEAVEEVAEETTDETVEESSTTEQEEEKAEQTDEGEPEPEEKPQDDGFSEREKAFLAKANDEKSKRQELQKELDSLRAEPKEPEKVPDPVEDPEAYANYIESKNAASQFATRISVSQELMRQLHDDYDEKEALFTQLAKDDPTLVAGLNKATNPAKFAYDMAVKHERMSQYDNFEDAVSAQVAKQVETIKEQLKAEFEKSYEAKLKEATSLPPSGAKGSQGSDSTVPGEESLTDILGN